MSDDERPHLAREELPALAELRLDVPAVSAAVQCALTQHQIALFQIVTHYCFCKQKRTGCDAFGGARARHCRVLWRRARRAQAAHHCWPGTLLFLVDIVRLFYVVVFFVFVLFFVLFWKMFLFVVNAGVRKHSLRCVCESRPCALHLRHTAISRSRSRSRSRSLYALSYIFTHPTSANLHLRTATGCGWRVYVARSASGALGRCGGRVRVTRHTNAHCGKCSRWYAVG